MGENYRYLLAEMVPLDAKPGEGNGVILCGGSFGRILSEGEMRWLTSYLLDLADHRLHYRAD